MAKGPAPRARRRRLALRVLNALLIAAVLALGAYLLYSRIAAPGAPLAVSSVTVSLDPPEADAGHCPQATYRFVGKIHSNGSGGRVAYQWIQPDGLTTAVATVDLAANEPDYSATLEFVFRGEYAAAGSAVLHVVSPSDLQSPALPVTYRCP